MAVRILHCGSSVENYELCIKEKVAGFINRSSQKGDLVYLCVKVNNTSYCGARGILSEITDFKPWTDAELYIHCLTLKNIEYCKPFDIKALASVGGNYWALKYLQGAKKFDDSKAENLLADLFKKNITKEYQDIRNVLSLPLYKSEKIVYENREEASSDVNEYEFAIDPDEKINIMGTFQTIHFFNETNKSKGLESLVNENFYPLFPQFPKNRTLLIPENRMFKTARHEDFKNVVGIRSIPDGILIVYNKDLKNPIQINLIEYECYGERKTRPLDKSNFFNGQIIPQLMKFKSSFSIVTDKNIRQTTINAWVAKIIDYINTIPELEEKFSAWIQELDPNVSQKMIGLRMSNYLEDAFKNNLRMLLIIDELSSEQRETLNNVINAFKLENGESIKFYSYVVRLVQQINIIDNSQAYALTVQ